jgi:bacillolysin
MNKHHSLRGRRLFTAILQAGLILGLTGTYLPAAASPSAQEGDLRIGRSSETGKVTFIGADPGSPFTLADRSLEGFAAEDAGIAYIDNFADEIGLQDPAAELRVFRDSSRDGRGTVRYQQVYNGVPVLAGELIVNTDAEARLLSISGEVSPDLSLSVDPDTESDTARANALRAVAKSYDLDPGELNASDPELWVFDERLLVPSARPAELVWRMEVTGKDRLDIDELVLVNARTGGISLHFNQIDSAKNRETYTANNGTTLPGTLVCNESDPTCTAGDSHAAAAHNYAGDTYDFYFEHYGRDSIDDAGMTLKSTVHYSSGYNNAFWNGSQMVYGDAYGYPLADDVVAHELTHGVTQNESSLFYYYQSGAINESFSDVWGEFVDQTNGAGNDSAGVKWLMGEDISGLGAIRSMSDPTAYGDPDKMSSAYYFTGTGDNGGVHYNSGINNKAAYLMTDGASFNGHNVTGIGIDKVAAIYYDVQTRMLTSGSDYGDLYNALYQSCLDLVAGSEGITFDDCGEVRDATEAVEMDQEPETNFNPDASMCPGDEIPRNLFYDDLESGLSNWTTGVIEGISSWEYEAAYAHSGEVALYGDDYWADYYATPSDSYVAMTSDVSLPGGSSPYLWFAHAFGFDPPDWDGGWVEYSTNGGGSWTDAGSLIDSGLDYTGSINDTYNNPNPGHSAYVDASHGFVSTRLDLSSLAGQSVRFRWRMSSDDWIYDLGWIVDDVRIYTCGLPRQAPVDFDGSGTSDVVVYSGGAWLFFDFDTGALDFGRSKWTGMPGSCVPAPMDYDGDGKDEFSQLCDGAWLFYNDDGSLNKGIWTGGVAGDLPAPADYNGDGTDDVVVWRGGAWLFYDFETGALDLGRSVWTGAPPHWTGGTTIPVPMDYDGDGKVEFTVWAGGPWLFFNDDGSLKKGIWTGGTVGDLPVPGDYDGDGREEVVVWSGGAWLFFDFESGAMTGGVWTGSPPNYSGGTTVPAPLDYDGDGTLDYTVWPGGPWHFYNDNGSLNKGIWTGGVAGDQALSRRLLP